MVTSNVCANTTLNLLITWNSLFIIFNSLFIYEIYNKVQNFRLHDSKHREFIIETMHQVTLFCKPMAF